jgi:altronate dehydratase small subunit
MAHDFIHGTDSLVMNEKDDVATVLHDMPSGSDIHFFKGAKMQTLSLIDPIPFGHKAAIAFIKQGAEVYKYGDIIGKATRDIQAGEHVHVHNIEGTRGRGDMARPDAS